VAAVVLLTVRSMTSTIEPAVRCCGVIKWRRGRNVRAQRRRRAAPHRRHRLYTPSNAEFIQPGASL
jgi:hypothetical protein